MQITIYKHPHRNHFLAVAAGTALPDHAQDWVRFKSIDLMSSDIRIGLADPTAVLQAIAEVGWAAM